jgi:hypothetical protein
MRIQGSEVRGQGPDEQNRLRLRRIIFSVILCLFSLGTIFAQSPTLSPAAPPWQPPAIGAVQSQLFVWLDVKQADEAVKAKIRELWADIPQPPAEEEVLDRLARTFALVDAEAEKLVALCSQPRSRLVVTPPAWLAAVQTPPFVGRNLRLYYARWLVQNSLYDEARQQLDGLQLGEVVAPAMLLFYQGVVYQKLLDREAGLQTLDRLLTGPPAVPRRYRAIAQLMREDLRGLEADSLDHISRRMDDIRRRLDLGRAGPQVRGIEDGVIAALDKLIKKLEDEQQQQSADQSGNSIRSTNPASDSRIMGGKGPGDVEKKNVGGQSGWGDLPPKEREEALQQIGRDFPAQYRSVLEEYFKRLAAEENPP